MSKPTYKDVANLKEDARIEEIAANVKLGKTVGFVTDADPGKADRYIQKLKVKIPGIVILARGSGPVPKTVMVKVGPPAVGKN